MDKAVLKVELRFVLITGGAQFAITFGHTVMEMLSANSLDSLQVVCGNKLRCYKLHSSHLSYIKRRCSYSFCCHLWPREWPYLAR